MEFAQMAQDFVDATSALVGQRTINIMDLRGIIIASTEKERIGTFHQGAAEVIATKLAVVIHKEDLDRYPGAKEGCNMPILLAGRMFGVVGIFGEEEEVRDIANLLKVYVIQYFEQQSMNQKQKFESEIRGQILDRLLSGNAGQEEELAQLCRIIDVQIQYPVKLYLFSADRYRYSQLHQYAQLEQQLRWNGILDERTDLFGIHDHVFVMISRASKDQEPIRAFLKDHEEYRLSISGSAAELGEIPRGFREVSVLNERKGGQLCDISAYRNKLQYLMGNMLHQDGGEYARQMEDRLKNSLDQPGAELLLRTAAVYYEEDGSVTRAAARLHLHKNTLLYRMNRLSSLLGLEEEGAFVREFFIRLMLGEHPAVMPERTEQ